MNRSAYFRIGSMSSCVKEYMYFSTDKKYFDFEENIFEHLRVVQYSKSNYELATAPISYDAFSLLTILKENRRPRSLRDYGFASDEVGRCRQPRE